MPTPTAIIDMVASLQNDTAKTVYTDVACLPYLNMALDELQEIFEQNDIPSTHETSATLSCPIGTVVVGFTTTPALPAGLIELKKVWESDSGQNKWFPLVPKDFLPHYLENVSISQFQIYAWYDQEIHTLAANTIRDLKLDYIKSIFATPILIGSVATNIPIINCKSYLGYRTAALCSFFIGENETRAVELNLQADKALDRVLGIGTKGKQGIAVRRRPFRASFKVLNY